VLSFCPILSHRKNSVNSLGPTSALKKIYKKKKKKKWLGMYAMIRSLHHGLFNSQPFTEKKKEKKFIYILNI